MRTEQNRQEEEAVADFGEDEPSCLGEGDVNDDSHEDTEIDFIQ